MFVEKVETKCDQCAHKKVCGIMRDKMALDGEIASVTSKETYTQFDVRVYCQHYMTSAAMIRNNNDICP